MKAGDETRQLPKKPRGRYKRWLYDPTVSIPRSTLRARKKAERVAMEKLHSSLTLCVSHALADTNSVKLPYDEGSNKKENVFDSIENNSTDSVQEGNKGGVNNADGKPQCPQTVSVTSAEDKENAIDH